MEILCVNFVLTVLNEHMSDGDVSIETNSHWSWLIDWLPAKGFDAVFISKYKQNFRLLDSIIIS